MTEREERLTQLERALVLAKALSRESAMAEIHWLRGATFFALSDGERCLSAHRAALMYARRAHQVDLQAHALSGIGDASLLRGDYAQASQAFGECLSLCESLGIDGEIHASGHSMMSICCRLQHLREDTERHLQRAAALAESGGWSRIQMLAAINLAFSRTESGDFADARRLLQSTRDRARQYGVQWFYELSQSIYTLVLLWQGNTTEAAALARQQWQAGGIMPARTLMLGVVARTSDDAGERRACIDEAIETFPKYGIVPSMLLSCQNFITMALERDMPDTVHAFCSLLEQRYSEVPWTRLTADYGRACLQVCQLLGGPLDLALRSRLQVLHDEAMDAGRVVLARHIAAHMAMGESRP
jgi:tetratricopeptide (TPR) repeat protein